MLKGTQVRKRRNKHAGRTVLARFEEYAGVGRKIEECDEQKKEKTAGVK